jgi:hypothetical protein
VGGRERKGNLANKVKVRVNATHLLSLVLGDDALVVHVALVSENHLLNIIGGILLNVLDPCANVLKRLLVRHVIHKHDALHPSMVESSNTTESTGKKQKQITLMRDWTK